MLTLANAELILSGEQCRGAVHVIAGRIADISTGRSVPKGAIDCGGDYLCPGLIELHTDNLERHIRPRPKVDWPHAQAIMAHDRELAGTGITTVFDALRVGSFTDQNGRFVQYARGLADEINAVRTAGHLKIAHHLHLRAEVCSETLLDELESFDPSDHVGLVSLMDHTPGQRQFTDVSKFELYVRGKYSFTDAEFADHVAFLRGMQAQNGARHEVAAVTHAQRFGAVLASHDDTTEEQVQISAQHGVRLAEFPTTQSAASACRAAGIGVMMGAPNVVRGGSHSGNVAAVELAQAGLLDILSSDYVPSALLTAALMLADLWEDLPRGIATVTAAPARYVGLEDRGQLAIGQRADLLRFARAGTAAAVRSVYSAGMRVA